MTAAARRWTLFGAVVALALGALTWVSFEALSSEARRDSLRIEVDRQQRLGLALWRVDATVTALLAGESARPWASRRSTPPASDVAARFVKLRVEFRPDGAVVDPEASAERPDGRTRLAQLTGFLDPRRLTEALDEATPSSTEPTRAAPARDDRDEWRRTQQLALEDFQFRTHNVELTRGQAPGRATEADGPFRAHLFTGEDRRSLELLFLRRATSVSGPLVQGVWLDWRILRSVLLESVGAELFPDETVDLVPEDARSAPGVLRGTLASLPAALVVRGFAPRPATGWTGTRAALAAGWAAVIAAVIAVGLLLRAAHDLGERRGRFVAAVTHELRTPLTTFCMYSEMLASGVVRDEAQRAEYLDTLVGESRRLRRIVDHVLAYARMGSGREVARGESVPLSTLIASIEPALVQRAGQGGFELELTLEPGADTARVDASPELVEELLSTLVDNACSYATSGAKRLVLTAAADHKRARLTLRDFGPGVPSGRERDVFEPFRRASDEQGSAVAGLGLGLALARDWARQLGGDVALVGVDGPGAAFELTLPLVRR